MITVSTFLRGPWRSKVSGVPRGEEREEILDIPGVWAERYGTIVVPNDCLSIVGAILEEDLIEEVKTYSAPTHPDLLPQQAECVIRALKVRSILEHFDTGCGKTPTAIDVMRLGEVKRAVIVCPAVVRTHWVDQIKHWWPDHPELHLCDTGPKTVEAANSDGILITSYALLKRLVTELVRPLDALVFDEVHYIKNGYSAARAKHAMTLRAKVGPLGYTLALTATPVTAEPVDLHNLMHVLRPGTVGTWKEFVQRYSIPQTNIYTNNDYKGLDVDMAEELESRLRVISHRITKDEIADRLPPFTVEMMRIKVRHNAKSMRSIIESLSRGKRKQHELDKFVSRAGAQKVKAAVETVLDGVASGNMTACLTWYKDTAKAIYAKLSQTEHRVVYIDGDIPPTQRMEVLRKAAESGAILVGTMASLNVGIDLTAWTVAVLAELYWTVDKVLQIMGRFNRLSSQKKALFRILYIEGSIDEVIVSNLRRRMAEAAQMYKTGKAQDDLMDALTEDPAEAMESLRQAAESWLGEEEYF